MFGAFKPSFIAQVGQVRFARRPFFLSHTQKRNVRKRLKQVDSVIQTLLESKVPFSSRSQIENGQWKKESDLKPVEKYYVFSRDPKGHRKPITAVPHFTKMPHPRGFPPGYTPKV
ncbi:hypothetical protein MIR68_003739 [Amoeboaphelidium protococcarum]|nr:hypothetical protein MIR68_003739 [Amoeboaphelidium protococcarum]KAI3651656.1 hypothetical protein MP228_002959 [Amoeboaphelidium protococcarum]